MHYDGLFEHHRLLHISGQNIQILLFADRLILKQSLEFFQFQNL